MWPTKEARNTYQRQYRRLHSQKHIEAVAKYRKAHPDKARQWQKHYSRKLRLDVIMAYGGKCALCEESEFNKLELDHVNGNGAAHRRRLGRCSQVYVELRRLGYPKEGFRVLCKTCNHKEWARLQGWTRRLMLEERAREAASGWVYSVYAWRGRSPEYMQAQVKRLTDIIMAVKWNR